MKYFYFLLATVIASTEDVEIAAYHIEGEETYALQFHPEVFHTKDGGIILKNFLIDICGFSQDLTPAAFVLEAVENLKARLGKDKVVLGLSGGVDSTVAAVLLNKAIGENLYCIFRKNLFPFLFTKPPDSKCSYNLLILLLISLGQFLQNYTINYIGTFY